MRAIVLLAGIMLLSGGGTTRAAERVVILEATASMAARFGTTTRFAAARDALVAARPGGLGLVLFGARAGRRCADARLAAKPGGKLPERGGLKAGRGRAAVAAALKAGVAAAARQPGGEVLLVVDGMAECAPVCEPASWRGTAAIRASLIVLGEPADTAPVLRRLRCIADLTNGTAVGVASPGDLAGALTAFASGGADALAAGASDAALVAAPVPPLPEGAPRLPGLFDAAAAVPAPNLTLSAHLGGTPVALGLAWRITRRGDGAHLWSGAGAEPRLRLPAGTYDVEARVGTTRGTAEFTLGEGELRVAVAIAGGWLVLAGQMHERGEAVDGVFFRLRQGDREFARTSRGGALLVPAGDITVQAELGAARGARVVAVSAGAVADARIALNAARLHPRIVGARGTVAASLSVLASDGALVGRSEVASPHFVLPAGRYRIAVDTGAARVEQDVTLSAGEEARPVVSLPATDRDASAGQTGGAMHFAAP